MVGAVDAGAGEAGEALMPPAAIRAARGELGEQGRQSGLVRSGRPATRSPSRAAARRFGAEQPHGQARNG